MWTSTQSVASFVMLAGRQVIMLPIPGVGSELAVRIVFLLRLFRLVRVYRLIQVGNSRLKGQVGRKEGGRARGCKEF